MLIETDICNLGDGRLDPQEALAKSKEDTRSIQQAKGLLLPGQEELEDSELAMQHRLDWREFIRQLEKMNPALLFKDGIEGSIAVYAPRLRGDDEEPDPTKPAWWNDHRYVSGFVKETLPEYSYVTTTKHGIANREHRGWRSVLIALIKAHVVLYSRVVKQFGEPTGERGWRWHEQLANYKGVLS